MNLHPELVPAVFGLLACTGFVLWWTLQSKTPGAGLLLGYWLHFLQNYGVAGVMHALPWFNSSFAAETAVGFPEAVLSLGCLCAGAMASRFILRSYGRLTSEQSAKNERKWISPSRIFLAGAVFGYALAPLFNLIPSGTAVSSTLASLTVAAWGILAYQAAQARSFLLLAALVAGTIIFPASTIIQSGFIGFGINSVVLIVSLVAANLRPRFVVLLLGPVALFVGLSIYVTYMRDRVDIRDSVWGGEALQGRARIIADTFSRFDWFNPHSEAQFELVDGRLNQNYLLGAAINRLTRGEVDYWRGESFKSAFFAIIPRFLWPGKDLISGSGNLVGELTGIQFPDGTSVGIGPVMELYANFGRVGLIIGSIIMGGLLALCDLRAGECLQEGRTNRFAVWLLLGLPLLNFLGSFVAISASLATAAVMFHLNKQFLESKPVPARSPNRPANGAFATNADSSSSGIHPDP